MNDDGSLERAARSWIEEGPTQAPERAVEAALLRIETTSQERDLRIPWRLPDMSLITRVAGAALLIALAVGIGFVAFRPAADIGVTPKVTTSPSPDSAVTFVARLAEYRSARDAVCAAVSAFPLPEPSGDVTVDPAGTISFLRAVIARGSDEAGRLESIEPPAEIATEHLANIQTLRDVIALLGHEIDLIEQGKTAEARTVDQATGSLSHLFEVFEAKYRLAPCP